jgi:hypothetical protein
MSPFPARKLMQRHMIEIRQLFAALLAARLGRDQAEIHDEGLGARDFKLDESIELELGDGSTLLLRCAFAVMDVEQRAVGVFTEHCGYFCFGMFDLKLTELKGDEVVKRHAW